LHHGGMLAFLGAADQVGAPHEQPEFSGGHQVAKQKELVEKDEVVERRKFCMGALL
jgi:hypothetical protein